MQNQRLLIRVSRNCKFDEKKFLKIHAYVRVDFAYTGSLTVTG